MERNGGIGGVGKEACGDYSDNGEEEEMAVVIVTVGKKKRRRKRLKRNRASKNGR